MKIKRPPSILVIHLKRFKYIEQLGRNKKLSYRVVFPMELKLNTVDGPETEYSLFAVVVHVGSGTNHGHYVSLVKSHNHWLFFDDENVEMIDESSVQTFFGSAQEFTSNTDHGYILFYESIGARSWRKWYAICDHFSVQFMARNTEHHLRRNKMLSACGLPDVYRVNPFFYFNSMLNIIISDVIAPKMFLAWMQCHLYSFMRYCYLSNTHNYVI